MAAFAKVTTALVNYHDEVAAKTHPLSPSPSCRITEVAAEEAHSSLVGRCEFTIDRRMILGETVEQITAELQSIIKKQLVQTPEITYKLQFIEWNEPVQAPLDSPLVNTLEKILLR